MKDSAKKIALMALFVALVSGGKFVLSVIPNVEVVSILLAVAGYCMGAFFAFSVSMVFCLVETAMWGFGTWTLLYLVYWPALGCVFACLGKISVKNRWAAAGTVAGMTLLFGLLSTLLDTLIAFDGSFIVRTEDFFYRYGVMYVRGIVFFAVHIFSNFVLFVVAFRPLAELVSKLKHKMFGTDMI